MVLRFNKNVSAVLFLTVIVVFVYNIIYSNHDYHINEEPIFVKIVAQNISKSIDMTQKCLASKFYDFRDTSTFFWFRIENIVLECAKEIRANIPFIEATPDHFEHKYYMIPRIEFINDSCNVISFGVGGEIDSEKHIRMTLPQCTFLGVDPNEEYKTLFVDELKGRFVQAAVAGVTGKNVIYKMGKDGYTKTSTLKTFVTSAAEIIEKHHDKNQLIDILNIDIEGSEYGILQRIFIDKAYENVCQINFELHPVWFHFAGYSYYDTIEIFRKIAEDGTFLWVKNFVHDKEFYCAFFINVKNKRCTEKYLKGRLY